MLPLILPPELIDAIIDTFHDDPQTLSSCALVCKSWVPSSRHHEFMEIKVKESNTTGLIEILQSERETISPHIRSMNLYFNLSPLSSTLFVPEVLPVVSLFSAMTGRVVLTSLTFHYLDFENAKPMLDALPTISSIFSSVGNLRIFSQELLPDDSDSDSQAILQSFLDSFPRLEAFWISDIKSFWPLRLPETVRVLCIRLQMHTVERLCSQRPTPRLSVLDISFVSDEDVESMNNALFPCVSETLEHLSMSIKLVLNRKLNKVINLAPLHQLQSLRFTRAENFQMSALASSLMSASSAHLRAAAIHTTPRYFPPAPDWIPLDRVLSNEAKLFSTETKFALITRRGDEIKAMMPLSVASGIVDFVAEAGPAESPTHIVWRDFVLHKRARLRN